MPLTPLKPDLWLLDPRFVHLNHGSYGAVPRPVLEAQLEVAEGIEASPERFYRAELPAAMSAAREEVAGFLNTELAGLVLVQNATEAVQVALNSMELQQGSEVIYTDHAYPWVKAALLRVRAERGATLRCVKLPAPDDQTGGVSADALINALEAAITESTALLVLDQITSGSALRLPVEQVTTALGARVPILVDGAHAPGLIEAPVPAGAAFWFGNLHKWAFAPRTSAALVVSPAWRERVRPLVTSAGGMLPYPRSFDYLGTQDPSAHLALPAALRFPAEQLALTFTQLRERNAQVLEQGVQLVAEALGVAAPHFSGLPLTTVPLGLSGDEEAAWQLGDRLRTAGVEVAVISIGGELHARFSVQAYVGVADFGRFVAALRELRLARVHT